MTQESKKSVRIEYSIDMSIKDAAKLLDQYDPTWYERINRDNLYMSSPFCCILGQLKGPFNDHPLVKKYGLTDDNHKNGKYGPFGADADSDQWQKEIEKRLSGVSTAETEEKRGSYRFNYHDFEATEADMDAFVRVLALTGGNLCAKTSHANPLDKASSKAGIRYVVRPVEALTKQERVVVDITRKAITPRS